MPAADELRPLRVLITGAAGLLGQNLVIGLKARGRVEIRAIDKHEANLAILRQLHPEIRVLEADLARDKGWETELAGIDALIIAHAQIGGLYAKPFWANNVEATERLLLAARRAGVARIVHVSSSVVNSMARDHYTESKKAQEDVVRGSGIPAVVLRPTLMFGPLDRKHLGWLARFMERTPVLPVPGNGRYVRQPLFVGDFCGIVVACLERGMEGKCYNISGLERIDFIDLMRAIRAALGRRTLIVPCPRAVFEVMLRAYALVDADPPFTIHQLRALTTPDMFEVIDWPTIFGVTPTPLTAALQEAFADPRFAGVELAF